FVAAILNVVTAGLEGLLSCFGNLLVAVRQSTGQSGDNFVIAAAGVLLGLLANHLGRFQANFFVGIVQTIDEGAHNLGVARAVELAELLDGLATALAGAARLGFIGPVGAFA